MGEFGGRGGFSRGPRQEFDATCAGCGKACKVPFEPKDPSRPVFCRDCWEKKRQERPQRY